MKKLYFSASNLAFYPEELMSSYENAGAVPVDILELTGSERETYHMQQAPTGKQLGADESGRPAWVAVPVPAVTDRRTTAKRQIDQAAGNARARFVSAGQLVEEEYHLALKQAQEWHAAGSPADQVPQAVQDWADASGMTAEAAATDIEETASNWNAVLLQIRKIRLAGKAAVDGAEDQGAADDMALVAEPYISQLDQLKPA